MVCICKSINTSYQCMCLLKYIDPPVSDGLTDHPRVPTAFLIFTIMATVIFLFVAMAVIVFIVLLRNHK